MNATDIINAILLIISCVFIVTFSILFDKITNRIAKVLKKSTDKVRHDIIFFQIGAMFILITSIFMSFDAIFFQIAFKASDLLFILLLYSVSIFILVFTIVLKQSIEIIEKRTKK
jgi:hypothetical protein